MKGGQQQKIISGYLITTFIIESYYLKNATYNYTFTMIQAFASAFTPIVYLVVIGKFDQMSQLDIVREVLSVLCIIYGILLSYIFLFQSLTDMNRKLYLQKQTCNLISPKKNDQEDRVLPVLNLTNVEVIEGWSMLRSISMGYGHKFEQRTHAFFSLIFLACVAILILILLIILDIYIPELLTIILIGEQALVFIITLSLYLVKGAALNDIFLQYQNLLEDQTSLYTDILRKKKKYFLQQTQTSNFFYQRAIDYIRNNVGSEINEVERYLEEILAALGNADRKVKYDQRNNSFKLYGVKIKFSLLKSVGVSISTLIGFAFQQRIQASIFKSKFK